MKTIPLTATHVLTAAALILLGPVPAVAESLPERADAALESCNRAADRQSLDEARALAERAVETYEEILEGDPGRVEARVGIAETLMECRIQFASMMERVGLMERIEGELDLALETDPGHWKARFLLGALLYNVPPFLNRTDDAVEHLETLLDQERRAGAHRSPEPFAILGHLYLRREEPARARNVWKLGLAAFPENYGLQRRLAELEGERAETADDPTASPGTDSATDPAAGPGTLSERLRRLIDDEIRRPEIPGMAVAVVHAGEPLLVEGFGLADVENEVPMTPRTVIRIGSITKQLTAAAVLALAEEGRLRLDDTLGRWLPEAADSDELRIHHLLSHTGGLPRDAVDSVEWIRDSLDTPRLAAPGRRFAYSNLGYGLLGLVVEKASAMPWSDYLERRFFVPLGMEATRPCDPVPIIPWRAEGYSWLGDRLVNDGPLRFTPTLRASGGLCSTLEDLLRWQGALHGGELLSGESLRRMTTPQTLPYGEETTYAFGLRVHEPRGRRIVHHSGGISGFLSELAHYPDEDLTVAVLTNGEAADPRSLAFALAEAVLSGPSAPGT